MPELKPWSDVPLAGAVDPAAAPQPRTGGWRTGVRPEVDLGSCVNCLLCWLYCPDSAVRLEGTDFAGFDLDF
jgi:Pyruvate/2-oxoacid:ferredoxin oxidoreductase delta subunit